MVVSAINGEVREKFKIMHEYCLCILIIACVEM